MDTFSTLGCTGRRGEEQKEGSPSFVGARGPQHDPATTKKKCVAAPVAIVKSRWHAVQDSRNVGLQLGCDFMCRARGGAAGNDETP